MQSEAVDFASTLGGLRHRGALRMLFSVVNGQFLQVRRSIFTDPLVGSFCEEELHVRPDTLIGFLGLCNGSYVRPLDVAKSVPGFHFAEFKKTGVFDAVRLLDADMRDPDAVRASVERLVHTKLDATVVLGVAELEQQLAAAEAAILLERGYARPLSHEGGRGGPHTR